MCVCVDSGVPGHGCGYQQGARGAWHVKSACRIVWHSVRPRLVLMMSMIILTGCGICSPNYLVYVNTLL